MLSLDPRMAIYKLNINPHTKGILKKKRMFALDKQKAITEEVQKLKAIGFFGKVQFPTWVSNIVPVKKANGKWRMCVNFTNLN